MKMIEIDIGKIAVGDRRREDFGDLATLADGIKRVGLLEPILVDKAGDGFRLIFGERRLRAVKMLGWKTIRAQTRDTLTDEEFRDIELEENDNRKGQEERERNRTFGSAKKLAEKAARVREVLKAEAAEKAADFNSVTKRPNSDAGGRGRKPEPNSTRKVAEVLGVGKTTVAKVEAHVAIAEKYPFMQGKRWPQAQVLKVGGLIERIPEVDRANALTVIEFLGADDGVLASQAATELLMAGRAERQELYQAAISGDKEGRCKALLHQMFAPTLPPKPPTLKADPRIILLTKALAWLRTAIEKEPHDAHTGQIAAAAKSLKAIRAHLQTQKQAGILTPSRTQKGTVLQ